MPDKSADLILFAGREPNEAYVAFGASLSFKDDPIAIVAWPHQSAPGQPLAWWTSSDWRDLMVGLKAAPTEEVRTALLRRAIEDGKPALALCRRQETGPNPGTPSNPMLASGTVNQAAE